MLVWTDLNKPVRIMSGSRSRRPQPEVLTFGQCLPAIDHDCRTGDIGRFVRGEEQRRLRNIARRAQSTERNDLFHAADEGLAAVLVHAFGEDVARLYVVDRDIVRREFQRRRLDEAVDAGLGGGIMGVAGASDTGARCS